MTFTYNLHKSQLEALLSGSLSDATKATIVNALNISSFSEATTIKTTFVDTEGSSDATGEHIFNAATTQYSNFTTSGQLLIADVAPNFLEAAETTVSVTDSAGGNYFVTGRFADNLYLSNESSNLDYVFGDAEGETIRLGSGPIKAYSGAGVQSSIYAGSGDQTIYGSTGGHTYLEGGTGATRLQGIGVTYDTLVAGSGAGQVLGVQDGVNVLNGGTTLQSVSNTLWGGEGTDTLWGGGLSVLHAGNGTETLNAGRWSAAADTVFTGGGTDVVNLWNGNDLVYGYNTDGNGGRWEDGYNTIFAGSGSDTIYAGKHSVIYGVGEGDTEHGGTGVTQIIGSDSTGGSNTIVAGMNDVYVDLSVGDASIQGGSGRLFINDSSGEETIRLGSGQDTIVLNQGGDSSIIGGTGYDTIDYYSASANATIVSGSSHTSVFVEDSGIVDGVQNADGSTTFTFSSGNHLTVDNINNVSITFNAGSDSSNNHNTDFTTFKNNA